MTNQVGFSFERNYTFMLSVPHFADNYVFFLAVNSSAYFFLCFTLDIYLWVLRYMDKQGHRQNFM